MRAGHVLGCAGRRSASARWRVVPARPRPRRAASVAERRRAVVGVDGPDCVVAPRPGRVAAASAPPAGPRRPPRPRRRGGLGLLAGLLQRRAGRPGPAGAGPPQPAREAVTGAGDDDQVGAGDGQVDGRGPVAVDHDGAGQELGRARRPTPGRRPGPGHAAAYAPGGSRPGVDRQGRRRPARRRTGRAGPRPRRPTAWRCSSLEARRAASTPSTTTAASASPAAASKAASQPSSTSTSSSRVPDHPGDPARRSAPARARASSRAWARASARAAQRCCSASAWRRVARVAPRRARPPAERRARPRRRGGSQAGRATASSSAAAASQALALSPRAGPARCSAASSRASSRRSSPRPARRRSAGPPARRGPRPPGRLASARCSPPLTRPRRVGLAGQGRLGLGQLLAAGASGGVGLVVGSSSRGQGGGLGLEAGDHVLVDRDGQLPLERAAPLASRATSPPARARSPSARETASARSVRARGWRTASELGLGRQDVGVEARPGRPRTSASARVSSRRGHGRRPPAGPRPRRARGRRGSAARPPARPPDRRGGGPRRPGVLERSQLAADLPEQVLQARPGWLSVDSSRRSARSLRRRNLRTPAASSMTRRRSSGRALRMASRLPWDDDDVLLAADAGVGQQLLDVEQPARHPVDGVLATRPCGTGSG